jgi:hypothetical protein
MRTRGDRAAPVAAACRWLVRCTSQPEANARASRWSERSVEAGEPTGARGNRRLSVVRAVHEPTRSEREGEQVCGPGVILTTSAKGAREMHLRRSRQVPRRAQRGALRSKVARGCARASKSCWWGARKLRVGIPRTKRAAKRSLEGCEQVGRRPHHRAARRRHICRAI